jgi:hypothetical protein
MAKTYQRVRSLAHLKKLSAVGAEFCILLRFGLVSYKHIRWDEKRKMFRVVNRIDGMRESLTEKQLMNRSYTNIGYALKRGALFRA